MTRRPPASGGTGDPECTLLTRHSSTSPCRYCAGIGLPLCFERVVLIRQAPRSDQFQGCAHLPIGALAGELGGERPEVDTVLLADGINADQMLLVMPSTFGQPCARAIHTLGSSTKASLSARPCEDFTIRR